MRICVIFNPTAKGDKARRFRRSLDAFATDATFKLTTGPNHAATLAAEAVREGFDSIVAAGGDGTVNEVLNGLAGEPQGCDHARLGVLPLGTVNVFARELCLPANLHRAWEVIRRGRETRIDLPRVESTSPSGAAYRFFSQLSGAGLDARSIELVDWNVKKKLGPLAYVLAGLRAMRECPPRITVTTPDAELTGELVLLGNGRLYGGDFRVFPEADLRDGRLDICVFPKARWSTLLWCGSRLITRFDLPPRAIRRIQAATFTLTSASPTAFEVDGELAGRLPARFSLERQRLRVLVP